MMSEETILADEVASRLPGGKVLIMSGDTVVGRMLSHLLGFAGFNAAKRSKGEDFLIKEDDHIHYDLALIDLDHPSKLNELCFSCKENKGESLSKIILSSPHVKSEACREGAEKHCLLIEKPFRTKELLRKVNSFSSITEDKIRKKIYEYYN